MLLFSYAPLIPLHLWKQTKQTDEGKSLIMYD